MRPQRSERRFAKYLNGLSRSGRSLTAALLLAPPMLVALGGGVVSCGRELPSAVPLGEGPQSSPGIDPLGADAGPSAADRDRTTRVVRGESEKKSTPTPRPASEPTAAAAADAGADSSATETAAVDEEGAGESDAGAALLSDFIGEWQGKDTVTYRFKDMPERVMHDENARILVAEAGDASIEVSLIDTSNGSKICTLRASVQGRRATIEPGQSCFSSGPMEASVTGGSARLDNGELSMKMTADVKITAADQALTGQIDYAFEGTQR